MFYVKIDQQMVGITPSNVFTFCPRTGMKLKVDLGETLQNGSFEPYRFFVEATSAEGDVRCIPLTRANVYAFCGICGKTFRLDLCAYAGNRRFDPYTDLVLCTVCENNQPKYNHSERRAQ